MIRIASTLVEECGGLEDTRAMVREARDHGAPILP
jgi:hypothetical protein